MLRRLVEELYHLVSDLHLQLKPAAHRRPKVQLGVIRVKVRNLHLDVGAVERGGGGWGAVVLLQRGCGAGRGGSGVGHGTGAIALATHHRSSGFSRRMSYGTRAKLQRKPLFYLRWHLKRSPKCQQLKILI